MADVRTASLVEAYFSRACREGRTIPSQLEAANEIGINTTVFQRMLSDLKEEGVIREEVMGGQRRYVMPRVGASLWSRKGRPTALGGPEAKFMPCMCCGKHFVSQHRFNRLCETCR